MKQHPGSEGHNLGQRSRRTHLPQRCQDRIPGAEAKDRRKPIAPACHAVPPSSTPENGDSREKRAVRTILVDLRPILEKAVDFSDSSPEMSERDSQNHEEHLQMESGDLPTEGGGGGGHTSETATAASIDSGIHEDVLPPPARDPFRAPSAHAESTRKAPEICPQSGNSTELQETTLLAALTHETKLRTAISSPKITPQEPGAADHELQSIKPSASLPDFHLPTQLLLQRLQETTTSRHHSLIAQVLSSLREELLVEEQPPLDGGHKATPLLQLPSIKAAERKKGGQEMKHFKPGQEAAKRMLGKFTWHRCHRSVYGAGSAPQATDL
ncbi:uncharacterized protein LOC117039685 [Lacerta agilis]|uniref:uncharacterized protein LOC117039685 n=1 Tax=Lacerta agilis TaxID=80427 RepID=UPI0014193DCA|nr:uncharacterized protein LOC117039685 [Lacerta agilis]